MTRSVRLSVTVAGIVILALGSVVTSLTGCSNPRSPILTVSAASDLTFAFQELGKMFEEETGVRVTFNFGSTGQLAQQIENGAPVDLFAAANVLYVDGLANKGMVIPETRALYARGSLVLWTRAGSSLGVERLEDLTSPQVKRLAIANPNHAPYGTAAREALQASGIWEQVQPKLVLGESVRQTLQYAQTGNVDAAIVALSLALASEGGRWFPIPQELHGPIDQGLAVIKGSSHEGEARAFAAFISGPKGRQVMQRYGFGLPGEVAGP